MRIAVCDDERDQIGLITSYIRCWAQTRDVKDELFTYESAEEFLQNWFEGLNIDLIFLDVKMGNMSGIELAQQLRKTDENLIIVFISAYIEYVFQGYNVHALNFLLKPIGKDKCIACLDKASEIISMRYTETFIISLGDQSVRLTFDEIYSFETRTHYIKVNSVKGTFKYKMNMNELEKGLPKDRFFRCHRSFIVNMRHINTLSKKEAILDNDMRIPISKKRVGLMNETFLKFYSKRVMV